MNIDIEIIKKIAKEAGDKILEIYDKDFSIEYKNDASPLTEADLASNDVIIKGLSENYSDIPVLSEESKNISYEDRKDWNPFWLIDPLDGTKEFIKKNGEFTVNIALIENGTPTIGAVYVPVKDTMYYSDGEKSFKQVGTEEPVQIKLKEKGSKCVVVASRSHLNEETEKFIEDLKKDYDEIDMISSGSSIKLCLVAEGSADVYPRIALTSEWDTGAAHAVVKTAGGRVIQFGTNKELEYNKEDILNPFFVVCR